MISYRDLGDGQWTMIRVPIPVPTLCLTMCMDEWQFLFEVVKTSVLHISQNDLLLRTLPTFLGISPKLCRTMLVIPHLERRQLD